MKRVSLVVLASLLTIACAAHQPPLCFHSPEALLLEGKVPAEVGSLNGVVSVARGEGRDAALRRALAGEGLSCEAMPAPVGLRRQVVALELSLALAGPHGKDRAQEVLDEPLSARQQLGDFQAVTLPGGFSVAPALTLRDLLARARGALTEARFAEMRGLALFLSQLQDRCEPQAQAIGDCRVVCLFNDNDGNPIGDGVAYVRADNSVPGAQSLQKALDACKNLGGIPLHKGEGTPVSKDCPEEPRPDTPDGGTPEVPDPVS